MLKTISQSNNRRHTVTVLLGGYGTPIAIGLHKHLSRSRIIWRHGNPVTPGVSRIITQAVSSVTH